MYKFVFFVPESHAETVKQAVFATGAGRIGDYDSCCWQVLGTGQFRPLAGAQPHLGEVGSLETVHEYRIELVCEDSLIHSAVSAMKLAHPYEEPAYDVWRLENI